ncbi:uncharacterized protein DUF2809 [Flavobacterium cutihirudinis]|uniref:Uncharacterized protein DUF2809 n=1 Tax=Flavobacterium cutihirudinis TaxID=1265740 RepID=A0A3D9FZV8_9FLAO|nr:DUF2809 domain-containing protein [Flavobacterium cutihirudinis]RED26439.1 uncharacterized protein DUF2809 [Flavobacterium cutihirudinis]
MNKSRISYFLAFLFTIFLGILSRKISFIPVWIGDFLYAIMIYFLIRIFLFNKKASIVLLLSLVSCCAIEFLQLYQADWIINLRKTLFGKYVLGQGFLWSDILAYTIGITFIYLLEKIILKYTSYEISFRIKQ